MKRDPLHPVLWYKNKCPTNKHKKHVPLGQGRTSVARVPAVRPGGQPLLRAAAFAATRVRPSSDRGHCAPGRPTGAWQ